MVIKGRKQHFTPSILTDNGKLNLLCPSGIGDFFWIYCKLWKLREELPITFYFPSDEQRRADQYAKLFDIDFDFLPWLRTQEVWRTPGNPYLHDLGWQYIHANKHLESGQHLKEWYPGLELKYPTPIIKVDDPIKCDYVLCFTCNSSYMEGNLDTVMWGRLAKYVHRNIAPVRFVGAGYDVSFIEEISKNYKGPYPHLLNEPIERVLAAATGPGCKGMFGVAGGPIIIAQSLGVPCYFAYPQWLSKMPGTWENPTGKYNWCHTMALPQNILGGALEKLLDARYCNHHIQQNREITTPVRQFAPIHR